VIGEEKCDETGVWRRPLLVLTVLFIRRKRSSSDCFAKISVGSGFSESPIVGCKCEFENQNAAVVEGDFGALP
jgi:hypothetical protein